MKSVDALFNLLELAPSFYEKFPTLAKSREDLSAIKQKFDIFYLPDKFNERFSTHGWIAYESMSVERMTRAIQIFDENGIEPSEVFLSESYDENILNSFILRCFGHAEFRKRIRLLELAKEDYLSGRYHACTPLILALTDGIVNDISKHVGFFAENVDMTAWDCIAAHDSGLQQLAKVMGAKRAKINEESINIPYRNGILHGRELSFDNRIVAAKCWATLEAVRDWARAIEDGKKNQEIKPEMSLVASIQSLQKTRALSERIDKWKRRPWLDKHNWDVYISSSELEENSPEKALIELLETWKCGQWGKFCKYINDHTSAPAGKRAGKLRRDFGHITPQKFHILSIADETPAFSVIKINISYLYNNLLHDKEIEVRMIYSDKSGMGLLRGEPDGSWKANQGAFSALIYENPPKNA